MDPLSAAFWTELAAETSALTPRDKITLLGDLIPAMGATTKTRVLGLPAVLSEVVTALKDNLNAGLDSNNKQDARVTNDSDIGCVAADLCVSDFLYDVSNAPAKSANRVVAFAKVGH